MPRTSKRFRYLAALREQCDSWGKFMKFKAAMGMPYSDDDEDIYVWLLLQYHKVKSQRYLSRGPYRKRSSADSFVIHRDNISNTIDSDNSNITNNVILPMLSESKFVEEYRMCRASFMKLCHIISTHSTTFSNKSRGPRQAPVEHQLLAFLKYVGTAGDGASNNGLPGLFSYSRGALKMFKNRIAEAICSIGHLYYTWPNKEERRAIANRIENEYGLPNCVGLMDGTLNELAHKPRAKNANDYWSRNFSFALSTLVVSDDKGKILYFLAGWPGCENDSRIYRKSMLFKRAKNMFSANEYLLADAEYGCSGNVISAFKDASLRTISEEQREFNKIVTKPKVCIELCIGTWKTRFPWLQKIPMIVKDESESFNRLLQCMTATVIMHNFLMDEQEPVPDSWSEELQTVLDGEVPKVVTNFQPMHTDKGRRREKLIQYMESENE